MLLTSNGTMTMTIRRNQPGEEAGNGVGGGWQEGMRKGRGEKKEDRYTSG